MNDVSYVIKKRMSPYIRLVYILSKLEEDIYLKFLFGLTDWWIISFICSRANHTGVTKWPVVEYLYFLGIIGLLQSINSHKIWQSKCTYRTSQKKCVHIRTRWPLASQLLAAVDYATWLNSGHFEHLCNDSVYYNVFLFCRGAVCMEYRWTTKLRQSFIFRCSRLTWTISP